jgi:shikimate kinase
MRVYLVGFMGAGKTTTGRALASQMGALFVDLDARVEAVFRIGIPKIFANLGEQTFRAEETKQLTLASSYADVVVACGGGTFVIPGNREIISASGVSVFLDVPWQQLVERLPGKQNERPLFVSPDHAWQLYSARLPSYRLAELTVQPGADESPAELAKRIVHNIEGGR